MGRFANLKLNTKLNFILFFLLFSMFILTASLTYRDQKQLVQNLALENSRGVASQVIATSNYMSSVVRDEPETNYALVPQVVATQVAKRISEGNRYAVRQISLNYRNPENRPDAYELAQLKKFSGPLSKEFYQVSDEDGGKVFRYMKSMIAENTCLECHGSYDSAPTFIQERYSSGHSSYNYEVGQVLGAVSVSWPISDLNKEISINLSHELFYRIGILAFVIIVMGMLTRRYIIAPIRSASNTINRVATTGDLSERIPVEESCDEIGQLICGFNEMMAQLSRTTLQRQESEDRYRSLVEAAPTAIITFLGDGKIVMSNLVAERLLGIPGDMLLGEVIFNYFENGELLKLKIDEFFRVGEWRESSRKSSNHVLRDSSGRHVNVQVVLALASNLDNVPIFTAIISESDT